MVRYVEANSHLLVCGLACAFETHGEICRVHLKNMVSVGRAVTLIADGDTALIKRATPPRSRYGCQHMVVECARTIEAVFFAEVNMIGGMGMPGDRVKVISNRPLRSAVLFKRNYLFGMAITRRASFDLREAQA